jgi:RND superfamily putative drug exporter
MVIRSEDGKPVTDDQLAEIRAKAEAIPGFTVPDNNPDKMWQERAVQDGATKDPSVRVVQNGVVDAATPQEDRRSAGHPGTHGCPVRRRQPAPWRRTASTACSTSCL